MDRPDSTLSVHAHDAQDESSTKDQDPESILQLVCSEPKWVATTAMEELEDFLDEELDEAFQAPTSIRTSQDNQIHPFGVSTSQILLDPP